MSAYTIKLTNGQDLVTIQDGMADTTNSSITLFGKNFAGYGLLLNENQVKLLENFSFHSAPHFPVKGQLWWDSQNNLLKVYRAGDQWKTVSGPTAAPIAPGSDTPGDLWWNTTDQQLKVWNGAAWSLVGPSYTNNQGVSGQVTATVYDSNDQPHTIVQFMISGTMVGILSKDAAFPIITIPGYSVIKPGFNLPYGTFAGNADNALMLGGTAATNFLRGDVESTAHAKINFRTNDGIQLGLNDDLDINVDGTAINYVSTVPGRDMKFYVNVGSIPTLALTINNNGQVTTTFQPSSDNSVANRKYVDDTVSTTVSEYLRSDGTTMIAGTMQVVSNDTYSLGTSNSRFVAVYARDFNGSIADVTQGNFNTVTINGPIVADTSAATKLYVDQVGTSVANAAESALVSARTAIVGTPPVTLNSIEKLATSINNDPAFYTSMMDKITPLAPLDSPVFINAPKAPTVQNTADSSDKIATTAFVRAVATTISGNVNASLGLYATVTDPVFQGRPKAPNALVADETLYPEQLATLSYVASKITSVISTTISNQFAPSASPTFTGNTNVTNLGVSGDLVVTGKSTIGKDLIVNGNLTVNGTTTTVNATTLDVADINITLAKNAATGAAANGAGLTVGGPAAATLTYLYADDSWAVNKVFKAPSFTGSGIGLTSIPNSATTANASASNNTIVSRNATGGFSANAIIATSLSGNGASITNIVNSATSATAASTADTIVLRDINKSFSANVVTATLFNGSGAGLTSIPNSATTATAASTANTIVQRDVNMNFSANVISATSTTANYADLAEMYVADAYYEPGTVLDFGGEKEVTLSTGANPTKVAGVVSTNPAYLMNKDCAGEFVVALALQGRVPCKVIGMVQKGDLLVSYGDGIAKRALEPKPGTIIGKALEAHNGEASLIEISISRC